MIENQEHTPEPEQSSLSILRLLPLLLAGGAILLFAVGMIALRLASQPDTTTVTTRPAPDGPVVIAVESEVLGDPSGVPISIGDPAPDFSYTMADGTTHRLSDLRGQPVMINFWATWCGPCRVEMPDIQAVHDLYTDTNKGYQILAVNVAEDPQQIAQFAEELDLTMPLITNQSGDISAGYGVRGYPTTLFIDSEGIVQTRHTGTINAELIMQHFEELQ